MSMCVKIEVFVTVEDIKDAHEISKDLNKILFDSGFTNSVNVTDDISE